MANLIYGSDNGVIRNIDKLYGGVDNVTRKITKGYGGVDNVARKVFKAGTPLGEIEVGSSIFLNVNGTPTEFLIVHQGLPSSYDSGCDGTWLLTKYGYYSIAFGSSSCPAYIYTSASTLYTYLETEFFNSLDVKIQSNIKTAVLPINYYTGTMISTGTAGLKVFPLSIDELSSTHESCLDYFSDGDSNKLTASDASGNGVVWWTRNYASRGTSVHYFYCIKANGTVGSATATTSCYARPALILPDDILVDDNFNIIT